MNLRNRVFTNFQDGFSFGAVIAPSVAVQRQIGLRYADDCSFSDAMQFVRVDCGGACNQRSGNVSLFDANGMRSYEARATQITTARKRMS